MKIYKYLDQKADIFNNSKISVCKPVLLSFIFFSSLKCCTDRRNQTALYFYKEFVQRILSVVVVRASYMQQLAKVLNGINAQRFERNGAIFMLNTIYIQQLWVMTRGVYAAAVRGPFAATVMCFADQKVEKIFDSGGGGGG